jgi:hypothetical protein
VGGLPVLGEGCAAIADEFRGFGKLSPESTSGALDLEAAPEAEEITGRADMVVGHSRAVAP